MQRNVLQVVVIGAALSVLGCGSGTPSVSGTVTLDGKPIEGATVTFTPDSKDGSGIGASYGKTDAQGRYSLRTVSGDKSGAVVGKHKVTISKASSDPNNPEGAAKEWIPSRYNSKSELTFDVSSSGSDKADFELKK